MPINVKNPHVGTSWVAIEVSKVGDGQLSELTGGTGEVDFMSKPDLKVERPIGIEPTPEPWQGSVLPLY